MRSHAPKPGPLCLHLGRKRCVNYGSYTYGWPLTPSPPCLRPTLALIGILMTGERGLESAEMLLAVTLAMRQSQHSGSSTKAHQRDRYRHWMPHSLNYFLTGRGLPHPFGVRALWALNSHSEKSSWRPLIEFLFSSRYYTPSYRGGLSVSHAYV